MRPPPSKCTTCGGRAFRRDQQPIERTFDRKRFEGSLRARRCRSCGEVSVDAVEVGRFDREVAETMAREGRPSAESFRWMRKVLGLRAADLAPLLDVSAMTMSRWETGERDTPRLAWTTLAAIVIEGQDSRTLARLRELAAFASAPTHGGK